MPSMPTDGLHTSTTGTISGALHSPYRQLCDQRSLDGVRFLGEGSTQSASADSEMYTDIEIPEMLDYAGANALPSGVPPPVWVALSPANTLPVRDLLLRHTPRVSSGAFSTITFSSDEPTHLLFPESDNAEFVQTIISSLLKAPLPSAASMEAIRTQSLELQAASRRSILLAFDGLKAHLPTWVGECVARMVTVENATQLWSGASRWLRSPASMEDAKLTVECEQRLASMGWNTSVSAYRTASLTTPDLASLLGTSWIGEDHMNAGGEWINRQLGPKSFIRVLDTHFLSNLRHNHRHFPTWSPSHPAELDQLVCNGDVTFLIVPVYLLERWAYLHVNVIDGSCVYVDSLHPDNVLVPDEVMNLFDWWLETVRPDLGPLSEELPTFEVERQLDRHSSGPATLSTMAHVALGGEPWTRAKAPQHRKRWFLRFSTEFETFLEGLSGDNRRTSPGDSAPHRIPTFGVDLNGLVISDSVDEIIRKPIFSSSYPSTTTPCA